MSQPEVSQQRVRKSRNKSLHLQPAKELCRAYVASVSAWVRRESWDKMHELIGRGGVFSLSFPSVFFFFFNSFYFILFYFLPSLKLSRNINLIENTYCTCTGYLVIKKQQRTTNEETGETCSIFRFWIWSEEFCGVVFRGITQNILLEERRFAGCQTTRLINLRLF